jgi:hypothetical protein
MTYWLMAALTAMSRYVTASSRWQPPQVGEKKSSRTGLSCCFARAKASSIEASQRISVGALVLMVETSSFLTHHVWSAYSGDKPHVNTSSEIASAAFGFGMLAPKARQASV